MVKCIRSSKRKVGYKMSKYPLSKELVEELSKHKCIEHATEWNVIFTEEFKQHAYEEYYRGKSTREIFAEAGLDAEKLGRKRLENFRSSVMNGAVREAGFADKRQDKSKQAPQSTEAQMAKRIRDLEHRITYLEQENDFLKKIRSVEEACGGKADGAK